MLISVPAGLAHVWKGASLTPLGEVRAALQFDSVELMRSGRIPVFATSPQRAEARRALSKDTGCILIIISSSSNIVITLGHY